MTLLQLIAWTLALSPLLCVAYVLWVAFALRDEKADEE